MAKIADVVVARTGAARCTQLLVVLLVVSLIINIIVGCLYGEAGCVAEETMEPNDIKEKRKQKVLEELRVPEQELGRGSALQNAREMQA